MNLVRTSIASAAPLGTSAASESACALGRRSLWSRFATPCLAVACLAFSCLVLSGCGPIGAKEMSLSVVYAATAFLALILLACHCLTIHKSSPWLLLMSLAILIVNLGYFALATSGTLEEALLANRIAYLGSVFLPMSMLMGIVDIAKVKYPRLLPALLLLLAAGVFLVAASPGYSDIYYAEVSLTTVGGISALDKVYGPWHSLYLFYLLGYFLAMIIIVVRVFTKKKAPSGAYAACLAAAVGVNIGVWFIEQLVHIDFEMLAVSYIISELFLLGLSLAIQDANNSQAHVVAQPAAQLATSQASSEDTSEGDNSADFDNALTPERPTELPICTDDERALFLEGLSTLTKTERAIYDLYLDDRNTQEILEHLEITSNTLKFHNKNLYTKLGVSSRKRLVAIARHLQ